MEKTVIVVIALALLFAFAMTWWAIPMLIISAAAYFGEDIPYWMALLASLALSFLIGQARG